MTAESPEGHAETARLWSLTEDTLLEAGDDGSLVAITWWGEYEFPQLADDVRESLDRLVLGPVSMANLAVSGGERDDRGGRRCGRCSPGFPARWCTPSPQTTAAGRCCRRSP